MDPADFLNVARALCNSHDEAFRRTSISRSYYALFNILHADLVGRGVSLTRGGRDHFLLVYYLTNCASRTASRIGSGLRDLRSNRIIADYRMGHNVSIGMSRFLCDHAEGMLNLFRGLTTAERDNIAAEIASLPPPPLPPRP